MPPWRRPGPTLPALPRSRGAVVSISSQNARNPRGVPLSYSAAKAALNAFSRGLAEQVGIGGSGQRRHPVRHADPAANGR
ncbi:SDR family NAD(P)-dependent oxidoreductase [Streptomyces swartbergensis]|uniref:SDR family NAD(P)-dependent oxidoreductase n=1 Tax=Streptomyces swartbergensis TaxID=487165 RepID=UPI003CC54BC9